MFLIFFYGLMTFFFNFTPCLAPPFQPFYFFFSFFSTFLILQTILFHSVIFNYFFQLSNSLYNIFTSQPFIPYRNSQGQIILIIFLTIFQTIQNGQKWAKYFAQTRGWKMLVISLEIFLIFENVIYFFRKWNRKWSTQVLRNASQWSNARIILAHVLHIFSTFWWAERYKRVVCILFDP